MPDSLKKKTVRDSIQLLQADERTMTTSVWSRLTQQKNQKVQSSATYSRGQTCARPRTIDREESVADKHSWIRALAHNHVGTKANNRNRWWHDDSVDEPILFRSSVALKLSSLTWQGGKTNGEGENGGEEKKERRLSWTRHIASIPQVCATAQNWTHTHARTHMPSHLLPPGSVY